MNNTLYYNANLSEELTFKDLYNYLSGDIEVNTSYSYDSTKDFILNLVSAIIHNIDITLIDKNQKSDLEIQNKRLTCSSLKITSFSQFRQKITSSSTKISIYTSGTTGQPKKITHSISNLIREVRISDKYKTNVWGFAYNPTHMAGLQVFFQALLNKNKLVDIFEFSREDILASFDKEKITHISATPTFYRFLLPLKTPLPKVLKVSLGGEKSSKELHTKINHAFPNAKVYNIYASTEAGTLFSSYGENFIIKENKKEFIKIENGELLIHKDLLGKNDDVFDGQWYYTSDLIKWVDESKGVFKFLSRKNEMINVGGNKVNPHEVEEVLNQIDGIEKSQVFGKPNSLLGNLICAKIVLKNKELTELSIKQILNKKLESYQIPRQISFVEKLELTRTGKLKRL